jgi:glycosyltransferase involved in cell wall biosynthesis
VAVHLFNPLWDTSGSEWRTLNLFKFLSDYADVSIWTEYKPAPLFRGLFPIHEMRVNNAFPRTGTFVFVGCYFEIGSWLKHARPDRVILVYNVVDPSGLEYRLAQLKAYGCENVELRFASDVIAQQAGGRPGTVEVSIIDLESFVPKAKLRSERLVIGRHSRAQKFKHHPNDPELYRKLVRVGFDVRVLGGTCLDEIAGEPGIELLPVDSEPIPEFLQSLDVFFYRTDPSWTESFGRVIAEAMACGLPCVAETGAGYQELIQSGENGFLFDTEDEAHEILLRLRDDPELRLRLGDAARRSVVAHYERELPKVLDYYLPGTLYASSQPLP